MRKSKLVFTLLASLLLIICINSHAQCSSVIMHNTSLAPTQGNSIKASPCIYAGEYFALVLNNSGNTYSVASSNLNDFITIRSGSANGGTLIASGTSPLVWTSASSGTVYILCNSNSSCGIENINRDIYVGCFGPTCTNTNSSAIGSAPSPSNTILLSNCQNAGEYATLNNAVAGRVYISNSSVSSDYYTIHSGSFNGPVVASGPSPLTWTAQVSGTHFVHVNTNSLCGIQASCRSTSISCLGLVGSPMNDLCLNAFNMAVPSTTNGTTIYASVESSVPGCVTTLNQPGVWYRITGNGNQFGASLCNSSGANTKLFVFSGTCGSLTCVTGNDNSGPLCSGVAASATWCSIPALDYYVLVTANCGSENFTIDFTQTVNTSTPSVSVAASNPSVCLNSSTALIASGASSYLWNTGATTSSIIVSPTVVSIYTVIGRDAIGCGYDIKTVTITPIPSPTVTLSNSNSSVCPGNPIVLTAIGANSYTFYGSATGSIVSSAGTATFTPFSNTSFIVVGAASNGCTSLDSTYISTYPQPNLTIAATNTFVCIGYSSTLTAGGAVSFTWNNGSNSAVQVVSPITNTIVSVSGSNSFGCMNTNTLALIVNSLVMTVSSDTIVCAGTSVDLYANGAVNYTWSPVNFPFGNINVSPTVSTTYTVSGKDINNCIQTKLIKVNVNANPVITATTTNAFICYGESATLTANGANSYVWSVGSSSFQAGNPIVVTPNNTTIFTYSVLGTDTNGCKGSAPLLVQVNNCTGINSLNVKQSLFNLYPNPNHGNFKVDFNTTQNNSIEIRDVSGRVILFSETQTTKLDINFETFVNGVYFAKLVSDSKVEIIKIIKQ